MKKLLVAVSGGVDSVVLLDVLAKTNHELVVAHFDHGIRGQESHDDADFVRNLSKKYGVICEIGEGNLSQNTSEEEARNARYAFLRAMAQKHEATIVTAHHFDDFIGSVAINIERGTGWRGVAVMNASDILRPLKKYTKQQIFDYTLAHRLEYVEDETNHDTKYLRNRLKPRVVSLPNERKHEVLCCIEKQQELADKIDAETTRFDDIITSRYFLTMLDEPIALELLASYMRRHFHSVERPQLRRLLLAVKTLRLGSKHDIGHGLSAVITKRGLVVSKQG